MKKIILLVILNLGTVACLNSSYAMSVHSLIKPVKHNIALTFRADELVKLSAKQFSEITGKKMYLLQKVSFKLLKLKMKHDLKKNPNLTLQDYYGNEGKKRLGTGWIILITVVGVLLILLLIFAAAHGNQNR